MRREKRRKGEREGGRKRQREIEREREGEREIEGKREGGGERETFWRKHKERGTPYHPPLPPQVQKEVSRDQMGQEEVLGFWEYQWMLIHPLR